MVRMPSGTIISAIIALNPARISSTDRGPSGPGLPHHRVDHGPLFPAHARAAGLPGLFDDLVRCETRPYNALNEALRERHGIATSPFEFLRHLRDHPASRVADLAAEFAIGIGATSEGIGRLENRDGSSGNRTRRTAGRRCWP
ncbi:hypothetical protein ABZ915_42945 [Streptomyces sp. NPDC046915]|uniref:hypothetical protein n=1 Tax=Streptomyces sp. NPDC046915 TaxID=3155257 RepID=UPI0033F8AB7E